MTNLENCRVCGAERPADAPSGLCPACLLKAGLVEEKTAAYVPTLEQSGSIVAGRYKLLETLGQGGMGAVFMAQQTAPVKRLVALKLIKLGMDSRQILTRFEAERQALALMDHPNIAKVLDAGATESGRPFFVMELVKGVPITRFCDERHLSPRQRLELFIPVCQAIQHAHQKGVIHRDIKPSNVLVALYDDRAVPKVIDFGVAKATGSQLTDASLVTGFGAVVGTPEYMSPEQAQLNQLDIDTRSDVYALGVLLYELLTGTTPIDRKRLGQDALFEILRVIREEEPPRPSTRLSTSEALASIAATRRTEPARLAKLMRGELDWIVMKCLEKDRSRRYETANGLARDLERYLHDEVVEAQPPTAAYRLRKLVRKHRTALATAATIVLLLVAGAAVSTWQAVRATSAEREARQQRIVSDEARRDAVGAKMEADKRRDEALQMAYTAGMNLAARAWEDNNVPRARELLEGVPKQLSGRDLRGFEWHYLSRVCNSAMLTLNGHSHGVLCLAFSADGKRLATGSADRTIRIWSCETGTELVSINVPDGPVFGLAFSPDGQRLVAGDGGGRSAKVWDSATGEELMLLEGHKHFANAVSFSPDGSRLASGSHDGTAKVWDSTTGRELISLDHSGYVFVVAFSPDGQRLASAGTSRNVKIWDIHSGTELLSLQGHASTVWSVAFSPDGKHLATGSNDNTVKIWDSENGEELFTIKSTIGCIYSVAYSPDGSRLAGGGDGKIVKIWDSITGQELSSIKGHGGAVKCVAFSRDGRRIASASEDRTAIIWDSAIHNEPLALMASGPVVFSPDGRRIAAPGNDKTAVTVWDSATGKASSTLDGNQQAVRRLLFSPDGRYLASASQGDTAVKIWDISSGRELSSVNGERNEYEPFAFSPDGRHLATVSGANVSFWETVTGKKLSAFDAGDFMVHCFAYSPNGKQLATGHEYFTVYIWDSKTREQLFSLQGHTSSVGCVAFSPDGLRLASASFDETVRVWDSATGHELFSLKGHAGPVRGVTFTPDGKRLATVSDDETLKIWDSVTGKEFISLKDTGSLGSNLAFSPDGERLVSVHDDGLVNVWDISSSPLMWCQPPR